DGRADVALDLFHERRDADVICGGCHLPRELPAETQRHRDAQRVWNHRDTATQRNAKKEDVTRAGEESNSKAAARLRVTVLNDSTERACDAGPPTGRNGKRKRTLTPYTTGSFLRPRS